MVKNGNVIDKNGIVVLKNVTCNVDDGVITLFHTHKMNKGEQLIFDDIPLSIEMLKPKWSGNKWVETASKEEIYEYQKAIDSSIPAPQEGNKNKTNAELEGELLTTQLAAAESFEQVIQLQEDLKSANEAIDIANAAIVDIYESMV